MTFGQIGLHRLLIGVIATAAILYGFLIPHFRTGIYNDDAVYVLVASDLKNHFSSKRLNTIKPDYPLPGMPLALAPWSKLIEPHWTRLEWVSMAAAVLNLFLLWLLGRRWLPPEETLALVAVYAFNPTVVKFSGILMPATFFTGVVLASIILLQRIVDRPTTLACLSLGLISGYGATLRAEGFLLPFGVLAGLWWMPNRRRVAGTVSIPLLGWGSILYWWMYCRGAGPSEFAGDLSALRHYWSSSFQYAAGFAVTFAELIFAKTVFQLPANNYASTNWHVLAAILGTLGCILGGTKLWKKPATPKAALAAGTFFCAAYVVVHVFWHVAVPRYVLPLLPFVLLCLFATIPFANSASRTRPRTPLWAVLSILLTWYGVRNAEALVETYALKNRAYAPPWKTLDWIRSKTQTTDRLMSPLAPTVALYTQRSSVTAFKLADVESFRYGLELERITYLVDRDMEFITPGVGKTENLNREWSRVRRWAILYPQAFSLEYENKNERTRVYKVKTKAGYRAAFRRFLSAVRDVRHKHYDEAIVVLKRDLTAGPPLGHTANLLGVSYYETQQFNDAAKSFQAAADCWTDSPIPLLNLATLACRTGNRNETKRWLNKSLEVVNRIGESDRWERHIDDLIQGWNSGRYRMIY